MSTRFPAAQAVALAVAAERVPAVALTATGREPAQAAVKAVATAMVTVKEMAAARAPAGQVAARADLAPGAPWW